METTYELLTVPLGYAKETNPFATKLWNAFWKAEVLTLLDEQQTEF